VFDSLEHTVRIVSIRVIFSKPVSLRRLLPYAVLLAEVLVFFRLVLFGEGYVIPWDLRYFHYPHAAFLADSLAAGELPLWEPHTYCGRPFQANIQTQVFYPPLILAVLFSNWTGADLYYTLEWEVVLHVFLAGLFAFWLIERLTASRSAALLGATVFQLGGYFASQIQHSGAVSAAAWMPLAWLGVLALGEGFCRRWLATLALALGMAVLAGLPAVTVVVFGSALLLALVRVLFHRASWRLPGAVLLAGGWALALAALQFIPAVELNAHSVARFRADWLQGGGGLPLVSLASLVAPNYSHVFDLSPYSAPFNPTFLYLYCGILGLSLALMAVVASRSREAAIFAVLTLACGLAMLGDSTPVGQWLFLLLPQSIRGGLHPEFVMPAFILGVAALAAIGARRFLVRPAFAWMAVAVAALDLTLAGSGRPMNTGSLATEPGVSRRQFEGSRQALERVRLLVNSEFPPARVDTVDASLNWSMTAPLTRVPTANGCDPLALSRLIQVRLSFSEGERWGACYNVSNLASGALRVAGIRYLLSRSPLVHPGFVHTADLGAERVYRDANALPRFFLVSRLRHARNMEEAAALLRSRDFDPRTEAIVEGAAPLPAGAVGAVRVLQYAPRRVLLEVDTPGPAFLVTSEAHYPGWHARLDGSEQPIYYTNVAFRGLAVPGGRHRVLFEFAPAILAWSALLSAAAWAALLWAWLRRRRCSP